MFCFPFCLQPQDAIDFVDNDIQVLGNFPLSPRIQTLLLARNRVSSIQPTLSHSIPNLTNLQLDSNNLRELADLDPLGPFPRLTHLVLRDNPVTKKEVSFLQQQQQPRPPSLSYITIQGYGGEDTQLTASPKQHSVALQI